MIIFSQKNAAYINSELIMNNYEFNSAFRIPHFALKKCPRTRKRVSGGVLLLVESGVEGVEVFGIEVILRYAESLAEPLKVYYLAFAEKFNRVADVGVVGKTKNVFVGGAGFLFRSQILNEVGDGVALALEIRRCKRHSRGGSGVNARGVVYIIGVEAAVLDLIH